MAVIEEIVQEDKIVSSTIHEPENKAKPTEIVEADQDGDVFFESTEYQAEELEKLIKEANEYKTKGNTHFGLGEYTQAIAEYENALMTCPTSLNKERAIYFGNIAACHLKQNEFKDARDMCTQSLKSDPTYLKALLRRAQANEKMGTSTAMTEALEDYKKLKESATDSYTQSQCQRALRELPDKIKTKMEQEKEEMMGKLKDLGNTLLGKFGLSTDNFQFEKDPNGSGGYSMNFVNK